MNDRPGRVNPLRRLVDLPPGERAAIGASHTPGEIWQQPALWPVAAKRTLAALEEGQSRPTRALANPGTRIILAGAGSSHFVGDCLARAIARATGHTVASLGSTEIVSDPDLLAGRGPLVLVHFARSGDSPESLCVYRLAERVAPGVCHLIVTCNAQGGLALAATTDRCLVVALDPRTNDHGLAMTSSFTNLFLAGLGLAYLEALAEYGRLAGELASAGDRLLAEAPTLVADLVDQGFDRALFLGSGGLLGAAREASLKMLEMTDGAIPSLAQSYLGVRHGPLSFIARRTLIVAFRSGDPYVRLYEDDLLAELAAKGFRECVLMIEPGAERLAEHGFERAIALTSGDCAVPDSWLPALAVPVGQILALLTSLKLGCRPDQPSRGSLIHRVVQGAVMHDADWPAHPA